MSERTYDFAGKGVTPEYLDMIEEVLSTHQRIFNLTVHGTYTADDGEEYLVIRFENKKRESFKVSFPMPQPGSGEQ